MKSAQKQNSSDKKKDKEEKSSTGKKLVQARLPFKILPATAVAASTDSGAEITVTKKRKLQFGVSAENEKDDENGTETKILRKSVGKSDVKENLSTASKDDVVEIDVSDDERSDSQQKSDEKSSKGVIDKHSAKSADKEMKNNGDSSDATKNSEKSKSAKLKIKFPFSEKKKRSRKNDSTTSREDDNGSGNDEELMSNPVKKIKKDEDFDGGRKTGTSTPSSVVDLVSDDDEPVEDSDTSVTEDVKEEDKQTNQEDDDEADSAAEIEQNSTRSKRENGICQESEKKDISSKADNNNLVEDDDGDRSSSHLQDHTSNGDVGIKNSIVRINKGEFKKLMKKLDESPKREKKEKSEERDQQDEELQNNLKVTEDNEDLQSSCLSVSSSSDNDDENNKISDSEKEAEKSLVAEDEISSGKNVEKVDSDGTKTSDSTKSKSDQKLTPARLKKLQEMEKRREERLKAKMEREKEKERKLEEKKREKEEKELQRKKEKEEKEEQKRREKEEKEEQRRKEKEEKEKKRLAEIEAKNEERRQKEEERKRKEEMKEEERRKKEEERKKREQEKEEAENKKKREAEAFTKFFLQQKPPQREPDDDHVSTDSVDKPFTCKFMPFQVKGHMKLAPLFRRILDDKAKKNLDKVLANEEQESTSVENLYLSTLKSGKYIPGRDTKTYAKDDESSDIVVIDDELEGAGQAIDDTTKPQKYKAKFLYFHENQRPPYYGTWRKKSKTIRPRRPFATDSVFDYEVDSDEEWEEEEPGESLNGSDDEKDKESEDDYEVDNEFFVPHGHLSEEEMQNEDEEEDNSPETQKAKLKLLQQEFAQEMKKKTERIKPKLVGIIWQDENGNKPQQCPDIIWSSLNKRAMIFTTPPVVTEPEKQQDNENGSTTPQEQKQKQKEKVKLPENLVKDLIRLFHGNSHKKQFLIKEFQAYIAKKHESNSDSETAAAASAPPEYSNATIKKKIEKMAEWTVYQKSEKDKKRLCWIITPEYLQKYDLEDLSMVNKWSYILQPKKRFTDKIEDETTTKLQKSVVTETTTEKVKDEKKSFSAITKFTKVLTKEEKEKKMKDSIASATVAATTIAVKTNVKPDEKKSEETIDLTKQKNEKIIDEKVNITITNTTTTTTNSNTNPSSKPATDKSKPIVKKRVALLMSVPRGQQIPQSCKDKLISDFLEKGKKREVNGNENDNGVDEKKKREGVIEKAEKIVSETITPMDVDDNDDVIVLN